MKKFTAQIICAILIVFSIALILPQSLMVKVGRGNKADAKIENIEEFSELLNFVSGSRDVDTNVSAKSSEISLFADEKEEILNNQKSNKYQSVTIYDTMSALSSSEYYYSTDDETIRQKATSNIERYLTIFLTENSSYYSSIGKMIYYNYENSSKKDNKEVDYAICFDIEVYFDENRVLCKFNRMDFAQKSSSIEEKEQTDDFNKDWLGKWIEFDSNEEIDDLTGVDVLNRQKLSRIGKYFRENENSNFLKEGALYTIKKEFALEMFSYILSSSLPEEGKYNFSVDFSNEIKPSTIFQYEYSDFYENNNSRYKENQKISGKSIENISFTNINNTICNINDSIETIKFDELIGD